MADPGAIATGDSSLRFFSPVQIDRILREGARLGWAGSHDAIERILKHEPGLERTALWQQIRRLKKSPCGRPYQRTEWDQEDERLLRTGYEGGWKKKREAVRELLRRHPAWQAHSIWRRAARRGLVQKPLKKGQQCSGQPWTQSDDRTLLSLAGYKSAMFIGKLLHRSEAAIRCRLTLLGKSSRIHREGFARRALARDLHLGIRTIQRFIVEGLLEVRDPRLTRKSLEDAFKAGQLPRSLQSPRPARTESFRSPPEIEIMEAAQPTNERRPHLAGDAVQPPRSSRARRIWADTAKELGADPKVIEQLIFCGILKFTDPTITEKSVARFCARYGALIKTDFLDADTRLWLADAMDLAPAAGKDSARQLEACRKHAQVVRCCEKCGTRIRGNAFFRHLKKCGELAGS
jgi:hypothetical protein